MQTIVKKHVSTKGVSSTFYDPRKIQTLDVERLQIMRQKLHDIDKNIGFSNCVPSINDNTKFRNTAYGQYLIGSPLSFHLNPIEHTTKIKTNIIDVFHDSDTIFKKALGNMVYQTKTNIGN